MRKERLFTAVGVREVPHGEGDLHIDLPYGWRLTLRYCDPLDYPGEACPVFAAFYPPGTWEEGE